MKRSALALAALAVILLATPALAGPTLDAIKSRGRLICGVNTGLAGFSIADSKGNWTGLDADFCRAVAAAILGDGSKVDFKPLTAQARFAALQSGAIDLLSRNSSWTLTRDASLGLLFTAPIYYEGQGFMVPRKYKITSAKQLNGATICVLAGTTTELNLTDWLRANQIKARPVVFESLEEAKTAFFAGRCQVYTTFTAGLASIRARDAKTPADYVILPEVISKEPVAPIVRRDDLEFFTIVKWTVYAIIEAEELGVSRANADAMRASRSPAIQRLLGTGNTSMGAKLGLPKDWAYRVIKTVGNYADLFDRNLGPATPLKLNRGLNRLWTKGGLLYAMPIR